VTVWSNNAAPGDAFTVPSGTSNIFTPGAALGLNPGFYYNNVRNAATVGIRTDLPRNGNGSAHFQSGPGTNGKADVEYLNFSTPGVPTSGLAAMGLLSQLSALSYEWYRVSASTASGHYHPSLRIYYDADGDFNTTNDRGYLIFERAYNPNTSPVPTDQWVLDDVYNWNGPGQSANLWMTNAGNPSGSVLEIYNRTLQDWLSTPNPNPNYPSLNSGYAVVYGFSFGVGSGWDGTFLGGVDTVTIGFNGVDTTYNFEVPTPASTALLGLGALAALRRRR
jgi:hypothetical protein